MACTSQHLRDIDIRAVWDGVQDHPVHVDVSIRLDCRPHACFLLLDRSHELVASVSVAGIRHITPPACEEGCSVNEAYLSGSDVGELVGPLDIDVLSPLDAEGPFEWKQELPATHQSQLAMLYRDITSLESFSPVVAAERWREIKESDVVTLAGAESESADGDGTLRDGSSPTFVMADRRSIRVQHAAPPSTLSVRKRGQRRVRADCRRGAGAAVPPLRKRSKSLGGGEPSLEEFVGIQRIASGNAVETDQAGSPSAGSLKPFRCTAAQRSRSQSDTHRHMLGVCDWMCSGEPDANGPSVKGLLRTPNRQHTRSIEGVLDRNFDLFPEETKLQTRPPAPGDSASHFNAQCSENLDITAPQVLERWKASHKVERSSTTAQSSAVHPKAPSWIEEDGKLYLVCEEDTTTGTYEVDLKAKIRLPTFDAQHHQLFCIPGLIRAEVAQDRMSTGGFAFFFEPTVHTSDGIAMRFESKTLVDYHLKESSHIIGRFRLDQTPLISIRTKKPVHCISDFAVSVEACAAFLPSIDAGVRRLHYNARLICEVDEKDVWADRVELFIVVRHGPLENAHYHVDNGTCTALHDTLLLSSGAKESEALISVLRNTEDMHNDLDISFSIPINVSSPAECFLPTLRPLFGKVLSESIILSLPRLPLKLEHIKKDLHTKWKLLQFSKAGHKMMRFDRLPIPDTLPQIIEEDPQFKVSELVRVLFRSLRASGENQMDENSVAVARNLRVALFQQPGGVLRCQMDVEVQIGKSSEVLKIDPQGWLPSFSYVDGRLATQAHGEWRETDDTFLTLFNMRDVKVGKVVHITFFFEQPCSTPILEEDYVVIEQDRNDEGVEKPLPRVVGMTILQAHMRLELENCTVVLSNPPESRATRFSGHQGHTEARLPMLTSDYHFSFIRDDPRPTTPPNEVVKLESPLMDEEEYTLVERDNSVKKIDETKQDEPRTGDGRQAQVKDIGIEQETSGTSSVTIDGTPLEGERMKMTANIDELNGQSIIPRSSRPPRHKADTGLYWYAFIKLCLVALMYSPMGKINLFDSCPLITLYDMLKSGSNMAEMAKQSGLDGNEFSVIHTAHNKLGESEAVEKEDGEGPVILDHAGGKAQREKDTGVLDWIDHALGWKG